MEETKYISLTDACLQLGLQPGSKKSIQKQLKDIGIEPRKVTDPANEVYQLTLHITMDEFERLRAHRSRVSISQAAALPSINDEGCFYFIDLYPGYDLNIYKLGFTEKGESRYEAYRTIAPFLHEVKKWPCKRTCESAALETAFNSKGTEKLGKPGQEVVECHDIDALIARVDAFFELINVNVN